ncbi:MAG: hypothetical protein J4F98_11450 [Acidobacteria bacterium]|nr:hypothetical protein [Acidobacteriota bacterium]
MRGLHGGIKVLSGVNMTLALALLPRSCSSSAARARSTPCGR